MQSSSTVGNRPKLNIGFVLDTSLDPNDGVQQYVVTLGEWLRQQGHSVHYLVGETKRRDLDNIHSLSKNIGVVFNGNRTTVPLPSGNRQLKLLLEKERFDVLHIQMPYSPFLAHRIIMLSEQAAIIGTFHVAPYGRMANQGNKFLRLMVKQSLRKFDKVLSVSSAAAAFARQTFGVDSKILPNVIDYRRFNEALPFETSSSDSLTILFLGRLVPRKGCLNLLKAISRLSKRDDLPKFKLIICGKGPLEPKIRRFVKKSDLETIVELIGYVSEKDKPRYYASADISVFPSYAGESFGIVLLEAMASGKAAVLAGNNPGYKSVMSPQPDLLFNPRSASDLADKIIKYLQDAGLRYQMAQWGRDYTKKFDVATVGDELLGIYRQALHKHRRQ